MGATTFYTVGEGMTPEEAFRDAVDEAIREHGSSGYSGTMAEKDSFVMITREVLPSKKAHELAKELIEKYDERIEDKWGPAGCICVEENNKGKDDVKVENYPKEGTKKWQTYYIGFAYKRNLGMSEVVRGTTKTEAIKKAKEWALKNRQNVQIKVTKELTNCKDIEAVVKFETTKKPNKYLFFGFASY